MSLENNLEKLERLSAKIWRKHDKEDPLSQLSFNEYDYLIAIKMTGEIRITDLASEMEVSNPSASNMVKRLESKGLVERIACDKDGRVHRITLSDTARSHLQQEAYVYGIIAKNLRDQLTDIEATLLNQLLDKAIKF